MLQRMILVDLQSYGRLRSIIAPVLKPWCQDDSAGFELIVACFDDSISYAHRLRISVNSGAEEREPQCRLNQFRQFVHRDIWR